MNQIKIIVMDVDGTLCNSQKQVSPYTKEILMKAQKQGIKLILASGRPTSGLIALSKELEMDKHHGLLVCYNGSKVVDCENHETLFNQALTVSEGKAVLEHMKNFNVYPMIDRENYMYVNNVFAPHIQLNGKPFDVIQYESRGGNFLLCEQKDLAAFLDWKLNKILTAAEAPYLKEHYQEMMEPFKDRLNCMFTASFYFEFTAKNIDKAKALDTVLQKAGYKQEEMIGFGDGMNDLSMLEYVGISVAMDNAVDEVKKKVDYITASNDDDGIAKALLHFIPSLNV